jgi:hypothetical protein
MQVERKKGGRGSQGLASRGGENGEERGGPGATRGSSATGGRRQRGVARPHARPNKGGGRWLTGGPRPQCRAAALADRWALAAQCRAARIPTGLKNISNKFKFAQTLADLKAVFPCSKNCK